MPRKGKMFEILVAQLEELLSNKEITIQSPDYIYDQAAERKREVDISIKGRIGSVDALFIIECRDHKKVQGSDWIEQLFQKTKDICANGVIAVSSSGFSAPAQIKAKKLGIELRTFKMFDPNEVIEWMEEITVEVMEHKFTIKKVGIGLIDENIRNDLAKGELKKSNRIDKYQEKTNKGFFTLGSDPQEKSIDDLVKIINVLNGEVFFKDLAVGQGPKRLNFNLLFYDPDNLLFMKRDSKKYRVVQIHIEGDFEILKIDSHKKAKVYSRKNKVLAQICENNWQISDGKEMTLLHQLVQSQTASAQCHA